MKTSHKILASIGFVIALIVIVNICNDCRHETELQDIQKRAAEAARAADEAQRIYVRTKVSEERLLELEKIKSYRDFSESEKEEARNLIVYMENHAKETGRSDYAKFFSDLRIKWDL